jgi:hypothetical protein
MMAYSFVSTAIDAHTAGYSTGRAIGMAAASAAASYIGGQIGVSFGEALGGGAGTSGGMFWGSVFGGMGSGAAGGAAGAAVAGGDVGKAAYQGAAIGAAMGVVSYVLWGGGQTQTEEAEYGGYKGPPENQGRPTVGRGLRDLEHTDWARTPQGQKTIKELRVSYSQGQVRVQGNYSHGRTLAVTRGNKIFINPTTTQSQLPGVLAHEGTHLVWNYAGQTYGRPAERAAYDAGYAVDTEIYSEGAFNPSDEWIDKNYKGIYY